MGCRGLSLRSWIGKFCPPDFCIYVSGGERLNGLNSVQPARLCLKCVAVFEFLYFFLEFLIYTWLVIYPIKYHNDPHFAWLTSHNFDGTHSDMQGSVTYWVEISQHQLLRVKGQGMLLDKSNQKFKIRQSNCLETVSCGGSKKLGCIKGCPPVLQHFAAKPPHQYHPWTWIANGLH